MEDKLLKTIDGIVKSYKDFPALEGASPMPDREVIIEITEKIRALLFPCFFDKKFDCEKADDEAYISLYVKNKIGEIEAQFIEQVALSLRKADKSLSLKAAEKKARQIFSGFLEEVPSIRELLNSDLDAAYDGDPAAIDKGLIVTSYPGFFAIGVYRIAHCLNELGLPYIARVMSEYAHSATGIDIHPAAKAGRRFFIDHGTGIVIGETTEIGENVKIYQGVTLGAISTRGGQSLRNKKRHPTIGNCVTIYSGASVLGGETVIGDGVVIGGNAFITQSVNK